MMLYCKVLEQRMILDLDKDLREVSYCPSYLTTTT